MPLRLVVGPANAGKVALLLERYLQELGRSPVLVVPTRPDVERVERDLLARVPAILGGSIGTFDDLFERVAATDPERRPVVTDAQRLLLAGRAVVATTLESLGRSARSAGFADSLVTALGEPVFAYGFEDLTASEWGLLEALAARTEVTVSLPYEPGRTVFTSLQGTVEDLARLAGDSIQELEPRYEEFAPTALAYLERRVFEGPSAEPPALEGAIRFLEGSGIRGALELVGDAVLDLVRGGTRPHRIAVVCPSLERYRLPLETVFETFGIPYSFEALVPLARTRFGQALLALLRFAWLGGGREDMYSYLRSPYSGIPRREADFAEGRLRGNAITAPGRVEEQTAKLR